MGICGGRKELDLSIYPYPTTWREDEEIVKKKGKPKFPCEVDTTYAFKDQDDGWSDIDLCRNAGKASKAHKAFLKRWNSINKGLIAEWDNKLASIRPPREDLNIFEETACNVSDGDYKYYKNKSFISPDTYYFAHELAYAWAKWRKKKCYLSLAYDPVKDEDEKGKERAKRGVISQYKRKQKATERLTVALARANLTYREDALLDVLRGNFDLPCKGIRDFPACRDLLTCKLDERGNGCVYHTAKHFNFFYREGRKDAKLMIKDVGYSGNEVALSFFSPLSPDGSEIDDRIASILELMHYKRTDNICGGGTRKKAGEFKSKYPRSEGEEEWRKEKEYLKGLKNAK